jgi:hypothetical protein
VAGGDAHRVWFPEMVEHLRLRWRDDLSIEALLGLCDELDDMLGRALEKEWSIHRKTSGLDLYGHPARSEPARLPGCAHADER